MPLQIVRQDITKMDVDAIVNTTDSEMTAFGGLDFAVHAAAGEKLAEECKKLVPLAVGTAKISDAYQLPCRYVVHTAGPVWQGGLHGECELLRSCYIKSLELAAVHGCQTVAVPLISAGTYGYPKERVLTFAVQTIAEYLFDHEMTVYLCVFDRESYTFSKKLFSDIRSFVDDAYTDRNGGIFSARKKRGGRYAFPVTKCSEMPEGSLYSAREDDSPRGKTLREYMKYMNRGFRDMLFDLIDESGMSDVECYKKANVDKRTFSKIKSNPDYRPSKQTVIAFAISLRLDIDRTQELLATVGFTLSGSNAFDKIIRYFIYNGNYDIFEINEALFEFDQILLGV